MPHIETAATTSNKLVRPRKLSLASLLCNHFHWKCLISTVLISFCMSHLTYCQISDEWGNRTFHLHYASAHFSSSNNSSSSCANDYISVIAIVLAAVFYLIYLSECWHHFARFGMTPRYTVGQALDLVESMRSAIPVIWWKSVSYHYVRRSRRVLRYRNGDAVSTNQVYYERINSNSSGNVFLYDECGYKDLSKRIVDLHKFAAVRMRFSKGFVFACLQAANEFEDQRTRFFAENETRDDYMEVREGLDLANLPFVERLLVLPERKGAMPKYSNMMQQQNGDICGDTTNGGTAAAVPQQLALPWWMCTWLYWLASLMLCSWPLRLIAEYQTAHVHFQVTKLFGTNYLSPSSVNYTGPLTRTSTMESHELEEANRRNYLIVPSYSEAILLEPVDQQQRDQFLQPANFFRQLISYPWRSAIERSADTTVPNGNETNLTVTNTYYGTIGDNDEQRYNFMKHLNTATMAPDDLMKRSRSISFMGKEIGNYHGPSKNQHLSNCTSTPKTTTTTATIRQHPPRAITISEGIDAFTTTGLPRPKKLSIKTRSPCQRQHHQRRFGTDQEPLLGFVNNCNNNNNRAEQNQVLEMHNFNLQQMPPPPDEPPPSYEIALRYCSPLYQRLRQSVHSLSSALFPRLASSTHDLQQLQYAMDGPASSSRSNNSSQQC